MNSDVVVKENTIILNRTNIQQDHDGYYNILEYNFSGNIELLQGSKITFQSGAMYYSWPNVTARQGNNKFSYVWIDNSVHDIVMPDGLYKETDIDQYIKYVMTQNTHYAVVNASDGSFVGNMFFIQLAINPVYLNMTLTMNTVPNLATATSMHLALPPGADWTWPATPRTFQFRVPSEPAGVLIGFEPGIYPPFPVSSLFQEDSQFPPEIQEQSSVLMACNIVSGNGFGNSKYNDIFFGFTPTVEPGFKQPLNNFVTQWHTCGSGLYNRLIFQLVDQEHRPLRLLDPDVFFMITIRQTAKPTRFKQNIAVTS